MRLPGWGPRCSRRARSHRARGGAFRGSGTRHMTSGRCSCRLAGARSGGSTATDQHHSQVADRLANASSPHDLWPVPTLEHYWSTDAAGRDGHRLRRDWSAGGVLPSGRRVGPRVFRRSESRFFASSHAERAHGFSERGGAKAVVLARLVPVVRTSTPVVAGVAAMPRRRFTVYHALGAGLWTIGPLAVGYLLGGVPVIAAHIGLIAMGLVAFSLLPASAGLLRYRRHKPSPGAVSRLSRPLLAAAASSDRPAR